RDSPAMPCPGRSGGSSSAARRRRGPPKRDREICTESGGSHGSGHHLRYDAPRRRAGARLLDEHDGEARDGAAAGASQRGCHRGGGFPIPPEEDCEARRAVARQVGTLDGGPSICGLSRVGLADIDRCWEAVKYARKPRIHTFVATSDIHLMYKLRKSRAEVMKAAV